MEGTFQNGASVGDQVVAGIVEPRQHRCVAVVIGLDVRGQGDRRAGNVDLRAARPPGQLFHGLPIVVARGEVHLGERAPVTKHFVDHTDALDELSPVEPRDQPHAGDHVAHGDIHRGHALVLSLDELLGRDTL